MRGDVAVDHFLETRLVDRDLARLERFHFAWVVIDTDDVVADIGEAGARDEADITGTDDRNIHGKILGGRTTADYCVCSAPAGSKFKSKLNLGSAFNVKVSSTPYSFTPPLSRIMAPTEATQLVRSR